MLEIKEKVEELVEKISANKALKKKFLDDPVSVIESLLGVDLPNDQLNKLVDAVKAKLPKKADVEEIVEEVAETAEEIVEEAAEVVEDVEYVDVPLWEPHLPWRRPRARETCLPRPIE